MRWAEVKENQFSACSVSVTSSSLSWNTQRYNKKISIQAYAELEQKTVHGSYKQSKLIMWGYFYTPEGPLHYQPADRGREQDNMVFSSKDIKRTF